MLSVCEQDSMTDNDKVITFPCAVAKVTTMADGSLRVVLDLPETAILQAAELMAMKANGMYLDARLVIAAGQNRTA